MTAKQGARLEKYTRMISKSHGRIDGLLASKLLSSTEAPSSGLESFIGGASPHLEGARKAFETTSMDRGMSPLGFEDTEAIIAEAIRPMHKGLVGDVVLLRGFTDPVRPPPHNRLFIHLTRRGCSSCGIQARFADYGCRGTSANPVDSDVGPSYC
ncbi:hypothetical protein [Janthinobacterium sp. MDT1-19]|uniref:hypothetical protein n=1 Tax=Janthinobacterium sp. MDT1-19 TaxID=1259339 RepID=UPI003F21CD0E